MAFAVIVIAYLGVVEIFPVGMSVGKTSSNFSQAGFLAQAKLEELVGAGYENIPLGIIEPKGRLSEDQDSPFHNIWRQTEVFLVDENLNATTVDLGLKKITIKMYYFDSNIRQDRVNEINYLMSFY